MYAAELMTFTKKEEDLRITERKIMRGTLGPVKIAKNEYRQRINYEILQEFIGADIVKKIKKQKWHRHVWRGGGN